MFKTYQTDRNETTIVIFGFINITTETCNGEAKTKIWLSRAVAKHQKIINDPNNPYHMAKPN